MAIKIRELTEHEIQNQIISYLWMKGYYVMRLNTGKYSVGEGQYKRFIMGQEAGTPDLLAFKKDKMLFVEVKRPKKLPTYLQEAKMKELEGFGATCIVATCLEDIDKYEKIR